MKEERVFVVSYSEWNEAYREEAADEVKELTMDGNYDRETGYFRFGVGNSNLYSRGWYMRLDEKRVAIRTLNKRDMPHEIELEHIKSVELVNGAEWAGRITVLIDLERAEEEGKKSHPFAWNGTITIGDTTYPIGGAKFDFHHTWEPKYINSSVWWD